MFISDWFRVDFVFFLSGWFCFFRSVLGLIWGLFRVGLGSVYGWFSNGLEFLEAWFKIYVCRIYSRVVWVLVVVGSGFI